MKRLLGLVVLSTLPVACGTSTPTGPEVSPLATLTDDASLSASARVPAGCTLSPRVTGITVSVVSIGKNWVTVRADALAFGSAGDPVFCIRPTWTVKPSTRRVQLVTERDPQAVTMQGQAGVYVIQAFVPNGEKGGFTASVVVELPDGTGALR
jgi:hypothetical protein